MTTNPSKALSRRDALKLLGAAAGASVLANLPSKWSTPQLAAGVLPAHAQTSGCTAWALIVELLDSPPPGLQTFIYLAAPDEVVGSPGEPGYTLRFGCQNACIAVFVDNQAPTSGTIRVTVMGGTPFEVGVPSPGSWAMLLDTSTGAFIAQSPGGGSISLPGSACPVVEFNE